jgi:GWxTD domain-containing protein
MNRFRIIKVIVAMVLFFTQAPAQYSSPNPQSGKGIPFFDMNIYRIYQGDSPYLIAVSQILYDDLTFRYDGVVYRAEYELKMFIVDPDTDKSLGYVFRKYEIELRQFAETNSRKKYDRRSILFPIEAGKFNIVADSHDLENNKKARRSVPVEILNPRQHEVLVSDIVFYEENKQTGERLITLSSNFDRSLPYVLAHVSISSRNVNEPVDVNITYAESAYERTTVWDTTLAGQTLTEFWHRVDLEKAVKSKNNLIIRAVQAGDEHQAEREVTFFWTTSPQNPDDMTLALRQMRYVVNDDSIDQYSDAPLAAQVAFFNRFWAKRDPTPQTERNELKEEYFSRVNEANRAFTFALEDGWRTDRGRILIKFGPPDEIENRPFAANTYPQVWWFYHGLRKTFLFIDERGLGEYRLHPDYQIYEFN